MKKKMPYARWPVKREVQTVIRAFDLEFEDEKTMLPHSELSVDHGHSAYDDYPYDDYN